MDLAYADIENQVVGPMFGNGDATFRAGPTYAVSTLPDFIVLADSNHDGRLDIVNGSGDQRAFGISRNSPNTDILLNNGDGTFQGTPAHFAYFAPGSFSLVSGIAPGKFGSSSGVVSLNAAPPARPNSNPLASASPENSPLEETRSLSMGCRA